MAKKPGPRFLARASNGNVLGELAINVLKKTFQTKKMATFWGYKKRYKKSEDHRVLGIYIFSVWQVEVAHENWPTETTVLGWNGIREGGDVSPLIPLRSPWFLAWRGFMVPTSRKPGVSVSPYGHPEKCWDHIHQTSSTVQPARSPYRDTSPSSDRKTRWLYEQFYFSKIVILSMKWKNWWYNHLACTKTNGQK